MIINLCYAVGYTLRDFTNFGYVILQQSIQGEQFVWRNTSAVCTRGGRYVMSQAVLCSRLYVEHWWNYNDREKASIRQHFRPSTKWFNGSFMPMYPISDSYILASLRLWIASELHLAVNQGKAFNERILMSYLFWMFHFQNETSQLVSLLFQLIMCRS